MIRFLKCYIDSLTFWFTMKNLKRIIPGFLFLLCLAFGCQNHSGDHGPVHTLIQINKGTIEINTSSADTVDQNIISLFKEVDSLVRLLDKNFAFSDLRELEQICVGSDGELTEALDGIAVDFLSNHLANFLEYLQNRPNSCLKKRVIEGLAGKYSAYGSAERLKKLDAEQKYLIAIAQSEKVDPKKIKFLESLFEQVDPNLFD